MAKRAKKQEEPRSFPVTLDEFSRSIAKPESRRAFGVCCKESGDINQRSPEDWQKLFDLFQRRPISVPWCVWRKKLK